MRHALHFRSGGQGCLPLSRVRYLARQALLWRWLWWDPDRRTILNAKKTQRVRVPRSAPPAVSGTAPALPALTWPSPLPLRHCRPIAYIDNIRAREFEGRDRDSPGTGIIVLSGLDSGPAPLRPVLWGYAQVCRRCCRPRVRRLVAGGCCTNAHHGPPGGWRAGGHRTDIPVKRIYL